MVKNIVERVLNINIGSFKEYLKEDRSGKGSFTINDAEVGFILDAKKRVLYLGDYQIDILTTSCNYGGSRYWFECPSCGKRVSKLYFCNYDIQCRTCSNLNYRSQQSTKTDCWGYYNMAEKVARQIDKDYKFDSVYPTFPNKPKYMKYSKYERLYRKFWYYKEKGNQVWLSGATRVLGWK